MSHLRACVLLAAVALAGAAPAVSREAPRFSLSSTTATAGDDVSVRVERTARLPQRAIRLYLVARGVAPTVRSRFDSRLSFIGSVRAARHARLAFTVPPLEPGSYALAYWCRGCFKGIAVQASPSLHVIAPTGEGCPRTSANGNAPRGRPDLSAWQFHGNGALWVLLEPDGILTTNALGGYKMLWVARDWTVVSGSFGVQYRMLDAPSAPQTAQTVSGTLGGYAGPSWASRMSFQPGCWQVTGRLLDMSLSFVVQVERGA